MEKLAKIPPRNWEGRRPSLLRGTAQTPCLGHQRLDPPLRFARPSTRLLAVPAAVRAPARRTPSRRHPRDRRTRRLPLIRRTGPPRASRAAVTKLDEICRHRPHMVTTMALRPGYIGHIVVGRAFASCRRILRSCSLRPWPRSTSSSAASSPSLSLGATYAGSSMPRPRRVPIGAGGLTSICRRWSSCGLRSARPSMAPISASHSLMESKPVRQPPIGLSAMLSQSATLMSLQPPHRRAAQTASLRVKRFHALTATRGCNTSTTRVTRDHASPGGYRCAANHTGARIQSASRPLPRTRGCVPVDKVASTQDATQTRTCL